MQSVTALSRDPLKKAQAGGISTAAPELPPAMTPQSATPVSQPSVPLLAPEHCDYCLQKVTPRRQTACLLSQRSAEP